MAGSLYPEFEFDAPDEHRQYFRDIATAMVERHDVLYAYAVRVINRHWGWQDHYGEYNWLVFHEEPDNWADHLYGLQRDPGFWGE
ncbi:hypothetical protein ACGFJ7_00290 [Actinoplanes sp. NPDC048988]|uniref:hypothetical protein n=1 Tax=Actinoplanes sp. NPDC048988 TaxID=3363901 RepID=UPI003718025C